MRNKFLIFCGLFSLLGCRQSDANLKKVEAALAGIEAGLLGTETSTNSGTSSHTDTTVNSLAGISLSNTSTNTSTNTASESVTSVETTPSHITTASGTGATTSPVAVTGTGTHAVVANTSSTNTSDSTATASSTSTEVASSSSTSTSTSTTPPPPVMTASSCFASAGMTVFVPAPTGGSPQCLASLSAIHDARSCAAAITNPALPNPALFATNSNSCYANYGAITAQADCTSVKGYFLTGTGLPSGVPLCYPSVNSLAQSTCTALSFIWDPDSSSCYQTADQITVQKNCVDSGKIWTTSGTKGSCVASLSQITTATGCSSALPKAGLWAATQKACLSELSLVGNATDCASLTGVWNGTSCIASVAGVNDFTTCTNNKNWWIAGSARCIAEDAMNATLCTSANQCILIGSTFTPIPVCPTMMSWDFTASRCMYKCPMGKLCDPNYTLMSAISLKPFLPGDQVQVADVDGDRFPDIVGADFNAGTIGVAFNQAGNSFNVTNYPNQMDPNSSKEIRIYDVEQKGYANIITFNMRQIRIHHSKPLVSDYWTLTPNRNGDWNGMWPGWWQNFSEFVNFTGTNAGFIRRLSDSKFGVSFYNQGKPSFVTMVAPTFTVTDKNGKQTVRRYDFDQQTYVADLNGDGKTEFVHFENKKMYTFNVDATNNINLSCSISSPFEDRHFFSGDFSPNFKRSDYTLFGNFTGHSKGQKDILRFTRDGSFVVLFINDEKNCFTQSRVLNSTNIKGESIVLPDLFQIRVGDVNGDGRDEVVLIDLPKKWDKNGTVRIRSYMVIPVASNIVLYSKVDMKTSTFLLTDKSKVTTVLPKVVMGDFYNNGLKDIAFVYPSEIVMLKSNVVPAN